MLLVFKQCEVMGSNPVHHAKLLVCGGSSMVRAHTLVVRSEGAPSHWYHLQNLRYGGTGIRIRLITDCSRFESGYLKMLGAVLGKRVAPLTLSVLTEGEDGFVGRNAVA